MKSQIERAHSLIDLKKVKDKAESLRYACIIAKESKEVVHKATEIRLRAERRMGELLLETEKAKAGRPKKNSPDPRADYSYKELNINSREASIWQRIAKIPEEDFEEYLITPTISAAGALAMSKALRVDLLDKPPLPKGKFNVLYADPPWEYGYWRISNKNMKPTYPTMSLDEICDMGEDIRKLSAKDSTLFLWIPSAHLAEFPAVFESWGFRYCSCWVWAKDGYTIGHYGNMCHELLLIGGKGKSTPTCVPKTMASVRSVQSINKTDHSVKPKEYYFIIEKLYPDTKRLELFARNPVKRKGWTYWGNQA